MANTDINFVVYAPQYVPTNGGSIFMHELVHALNERGERAFLWKKPPFWVPPNKRLKYWLGLYPYNTGPGLNTPFAKASDITERTVVVYPEIAIGNPLKGRNVARWLLYTPGLRNPYEFGEDETYFRVDEFADLPELTGGATDLFLWKINPAYRNENRPDRKGACFIVRKWGDGPRHPVTENAIQLDGKSHEEINEIFNQCDTFYSYDDATMYSQYAAVAGCLSVVIPRGDSSRDEMLSNHMLSRYGIAFGFEDDQIAHAKETQDKVLDLLKERERAGQATVDRFIEIMKAKVAERLEAV